jgi:RalA-binding protein 1
LDQALSERNQLSSQNSQLWKLIEKQRSGYNQMLKELERVRAERDSLRARLASGEGGKDKPVKSSSSSSAVSSSGGSSGTEGMPANSHHPKDHSDDLGEFYTSVWH